MENGNRWHRYFMDLALITASMSKSQRLKVGAVIVKNNTIISSGYNGLPSKYEPDILEDDNGNTKDEVIHAELNAILHCAKNGTSCNDATLYVTHSPCKSCAALIIQSGIKQIYYLNEYRISSMKIFNVCNVKVDKLTL